MWASEKTDFNPQNPHSEKKQLAPTRCPVTQTQNKS